jgi:ubiquinone/menaquinone biosynthesis C-methylase UbiE
MPGTASARRFGILFSGPDQYRKQTLNDQSLSDIWERGDRYERYIGRWSRMMAPAFLGWLNCSSGLKWMDVGCGTGALSAAIVDRASPVSVIGVEPSRGFIRIAGHSLGGNVWLSQGTGTHIPTADACVDVVVSGLVLNFIDNPQAALAEMSRVTLPNGIAAAYVWDYAEKMEMLRIFWDAARALDPGARSLDEGSRFPLCHPEALKELFTSMGLRKVETTAVGIQTVFDNFTDFWQPFLGGQGPAPAYVMSLEPNARAHLRDELFNRLPVEANGSISLAARAWAVRGEI